MPTLAIVHATLIDGTGADPRPGTTIVLVDGRIRAIGPDAEVAPPDTAEVVDATGRFVIPGLMDANVHLVSARTPDTLLELEDRYEDLALEAAQITLKHGVTTVFDTWGPAAPTRAVRDRIEQGTAVGSRVRFAGNILGLSGPLADDFFPTARMLEPSTIERVNAQWEHGTGGRLVYLTPDEVGEAVRQYIAEQDVDFVKYAATDHVATGYLMLSEASQRRIVEVAHEAGLTVQAHTTTVESLRIEIEVGCDLLQHPDATIGRAIPDDLLARIAEEQLPSATLLRTDANEAWHAAQEGGGGFDAHMPANHRAFVEHGVKMLLTTDGFAYGQRVKNHPGFRRGIRDDVPDMPSQLGSGHLHWLTAAVERGLTPMQALRAATLSVAEAYHVADDLGSVEEGKIADLLVLDADPLASPDHYRRIVHVIKDGTVVDRAALATDLLLADDPDSTT